MVASWIEEPSARMVVDANFGTGRGKGGWTTAEGSRDETLAEEAKPFRWCDWKRVACAKMVEVGRVEVEKARIELNAEDEAVAIDEDDEADVAWYCAAISRQLFRSGFLPALRSAICLALASLMLSLLPSSVSLVMRSSTVGEEIQSKVS